MIKFISLFSGSAGNSYFLKIDNRKFLIDVGMSRSRIVKELEKLDYKLSDIDAIFITHEHTDHIKGLEIINKYFNIPIYMNKETSKEVLKVFPDLNKDDIKIFENKEFIVKNIKVLPFSISHDAIDPVGFSFFDIEDKKITIATDLGEIDDEVYDNLAGSDILVLESNYDENLIRSSNYPIELIKRIKSSKGHLSNTKASELIAEFVDKGLENIALGHISQNNNNPEIVYQIAREKINSKKFENGNFNLKILQPDNYSGEIILN